MGLSLFYLFLLKFEFVETLGFTGLTWWMSYDRGGQQDFFHSASLSPERAVTGWTLGAAEMALNRFMWGLLLPWEVVPWEWKGLVTQVQPGMAHLHRWNGPSSLEGYPHKRHGARHSAWDKTVSCYSHSLHFHFSSSSSSWSNYLTLLLKSEKAMAPHSSTLAWRIPGTGEPGGLPSVGSHRVGHDWSNLAAAAAEISAICGLWCHSNGRKRRGTKEPLDEGEGGEWKSWLKTKY